MRRSFPYKLNAMTNEARQSKAESAGMSANALADGSERLLFSQSTKLFLMA